MATINVTTTVDENNGTGEVSLREAIIQANSTLVEDNIILTAGQTYKLTLANTTAEDKAATGDLDIVAGGKTTISVVGDGKATIDAGSIDRVFEVTSKVASLTLKNIVVTGGKIDTTSSLDAGGGIYNLGNLELESSIVSGNASGEFGGGIHSSGNLNIINSTINENSGSAGGGIHNQGIAKITNSNIAFNKGSGIFNWSNDLTVSNSTISSNLTSGPGGGIYNRGGLTVTNSTISSNLASGAGGGIYGSGIFGDSNLNIGNSIVAKNISSDSLDISKRYSTVVNLTSQGNNLIGSTSYTLTTGLTTTDKIGVDPLLGSLQNNGGPTATHALLGGSPAIDAGTSTLTRDQRGFGRIGVADIGAFEYNGINDLIPPSVSSFSPADEATSILPTTDLVINFSEPIKKGTGGNIFIRKVSDNTLVETIAGTSDKIIVNGSQATINPGIDLAGGIDYYVEITPDVVTDAIGNNFLGITGSTTWNFRTVDTTPPTMVSISPIDNATAVALAENLVVNFNETVQKGTGNILIKKLADNSVVETIDVTGTNVTATNTQLTIDPINNLAENTAYYVEIANGAVKDIAGNAYPGIVGGETWNFKTADVTAPKHTVLNPANNATNVKVGANLVAQFNEAIQKGTTGNILIKEVNGDDLIETIPVTATNITVGGNQLTINPTKDLGSKTNYYVEIEEGVIKDLAGNSYEGISDNDTWTFQTPDILAPITQTFSPKDNSTKVKPTDNLVVTFDEPIKKGKGNIIIKKVDTGSVVESIKMTSKAITTSGNKLTINPSKNLGLNTEYYVEIGKGAIKDVAGNNHPGIKGKTTWNFSTVTATSSSDLIVGTEKADVIDGLAGNDSITGLAGNDKLTGGDGNDRLDGSDGNDSLIGGAGNDVFLTSAGNDILTGGVGADQLIYNTDAKFATKEIGVDTISDFSRNQGDKIVLSQGTFEKIDSKVGNGLSVKTEFASVKNNPGASDALIVYNSSTGQLFYNENGKALGFGTGGEFLKLTNKTGLSISDFVIQA